MLAPKRGVQDPAGRNDIFFEGDEIRVLSKTTSPNAQLTIEVTRNTQGQTSKFSRELDRTQWDTASQNSIPFDKVVVVEVLGFHLLECIGVMVHFLTTRRYLKIVNDEFSLNEQCMNINVYEGM